MNAWRRRGELPPQTRPAVMEEAEPEPEGPEEAEAEKVLEGLRRFVDWLIGFEEEIPVEEKFQVVSESDLRALVEMAEECLSTRSDEYSSYPTPEEREALERVWAVLGRPCPDYFRKHFGWKEPAVA